MQNSFLEHLKPFPAKNSFVYSFEGIEGSGKSSQIQNLSEFLTAKGLKVLCLREPGGTEFGESLRKAILGSKAPLLPISEAYLFASSRAQLLNEKVLPFLAKENAAVILDRYIDSSLAYQGEARGLGAEQILQIHQPYPLYLMPHKTFYLDIDIKTSLERQAKRGQEKDYFELEKQEFSEKLIKGFEDCLKLFPNRIVRIDGTKNQNQVFEQIKKFL